MRHLYHRNVVLLFEVISDPAEDTIFMVMEVGSPVKQSGFVPLPGSLARSQPPGHL